MGAGAVGSLYGGMLQRAGARVSALCRSDYELARSKGLEVKIIWGDLLFRPDQVYRLAAEVSTAPDYLVVAYKVLPEIDRAELIRGAVGTQTSIVLLQNGVEIEAPVAAAYPANEIISALAFVCCNRVGPGEFRHLDYGRLSIGVYPRGISEKVRLLRDLFERVGVPVILHEDIVSARWEKLVWNAPFNPISVLGGGVTTTDILASPPAIFLVEAVMREVCAIAAAAGSPLPETVIGDMLEDTRKMKSYKTSMLLDWEAGRSMEVEAILGNAVRAAARTGVAAPHLRSLFALLSLLDRYKPGKVGTKVD